MKCNDCEYDLRDHRGDWAFALAGTEGVDGFIAAGAVRAHCPACGAAMSLTLERLGLSSSQQEGRPSLVRFAENTTTDLGVVAVGALKLHFGDRIVVRTLRGLCYPAVPAFVEELEPGQTVARKRVPDLPLLPESLDLVDWNKPRAPPQIAGDQVTYAVWLKGRPRAENITVRIADAAGVAGVALDLWPDLPYVEWRRYFVRATVRADAQRALEQKKQSLVAFVDVEQDGVHLVHPLAVRGASLAATTGARPRWVSLELRGPATPSGGAGAALAGGAFVVDAVSQRYPEAAGVQIAVDFGTSNTCVAVQQEGQATRSVSFTDLTKRLVAGARPEAPHEEPVHGWPSRGYGKSGVVLPTELLFSMPKNALTVGAVDAALPLVDFSLIGPWSALTTSDNESAHVHAEFKWASGEAGAMNRALQRRYLELCFLFTFAQLAKQSWLPAKAPVTVHGSYPLAFDSTAQDALVRTFRAALESAELGAFGAVGRAMLATPFVDESVAAGRVAKIAGATEALVVDIGGGSTDIALVRPDKELHWEIITSVRYAGTGLLSELVKSSCIQAKDLSTLRRRLRETTSVAELLKDPSIVRSNYLVGIVGRTKLFYSHLQEYLARLVAARVVAGEVKRVHPDSASLELRFCSLGNGWGFGEWLNGSHERLFTQKLGRRINEIIGWYRAKDPADLPAALRTAHPYVDVTVRPVSLDDIEPKQAVAYGLLSGQATRGSTFKGESMDELRRKGHRAHASIVGIDVSLPDKKFRAAWYLDVGSLQSLPPAGATKCPETGRVEVSSEVPWPQDDFVAPTGDLDAVLLAVQEKALASGGVEWLSRSPYEVLLEELWLKRLHGMAA